MSEQNAAAHRLSTESERGPIGRRPMLAGVMGVAAAVTGVAVTSGVAVAATSDKTGKVDASRPSYQVINPADIPAPLGYSHGISVRAERTVLLAGQVGQNPDGSWAVGVVAQYERALRNLLAVVRDAGGRPKHLVRLTAYVTDLPAFQAHYDEIQAVWRRLVGPDYPAQAVIGVNRLWFPEALMEIEGTAVLYT
ncbi:Rid family hydrolase [Streptomyces sp. NPDC026672]|uniref:RidA family protein n=1 Tax=unclassified Streptomyces TaxID=2593676 RepID=UPI0033F4D7ED